MQHCDKPLSLLPELIKCVLLLDYLDFGLPPASLWHLLHAALVSLFLSEDHLSSKGTLFLLKFSITSLLELSLSSKA
jgi:hypothetical protein